MIVAGDRLLAAPVACGGLLLIGDPHVSSRRPGRRKDPDWPAPVLAKLERCAAIANERDLAPVFLGDMFDEAVEPNQGLMTRLVRILKRFRHRPIVNVGNHDMGHTTLSDEDSLAMLGLCDVVDVVAASGPAAEFRVEGRRLGVGMTPFGQEIPRDVEGLFPGADAVAWFTHHDVAFEGAYPGAAEPFSVEGCAVVVNGHMHATKTPVQAGATLWMNPGNITRRSVDLLDHVPRAWILGPDGRLHPETLPHGGDVFDLTGRLVQPARESQVAESVESAFVSLLKTESATDLARSDDGSLLKEEVEAKFERDRTPEAVRAVVRSLLAEAVERRKG